MSVSACESLLHCTNSLLYTIHIKYCACVNVTLLGKKEINACMCTVCLFIIIWLLCIELYSQCQLSRVCYSVCLCL